MIIITCEDQGLPEEDLRKRMFVLYYSLCLKRTSVLSGQIVWSHQCPLKTESTVYIYIQPWKTSAIP